MPLLGAFLVPGLPHPLLKPDVLPWGRLASAHQRAGRAVASLRPDVLIMYSTQWMAVLDQLWQTRPRSQGLHVDENWHDIGDLRFDLVADTELAHACVASTRIIGVNSKAVNYDAFPIDTGTIVANAFLNTAKAPVVVCANNLYHDRGITTGLGRLAAAKAEEFGRRFVAVGIGGLSGAMFRHAFEPREDRILDAESDKANRQLLDQLERGDVAGLKRMLPDYVQQAKPDMDMKHLAFLLGAMGEKFYGARVHGYGPIYGSGAAVVEFSI